MVVQAGNLQTHIHPHTILQSTFTTSLPARTTAIDVEFVAMVSANVIPAIMELNANTQCVLILYVITI